MAESPNRQKEIFLKAMDLVSPEERAAFLDQACAGDDALRQRIEAMLKAHTASDSFLEKPAAAVGATIDQPPRHLEERGGSEAQESNRAIADCVPAGLKAAGLPEAAVQLVGTSDRAAVGDWVN